MFVKLKLYNYLDISLIEYVHILSVCVYVCYNILFICIVHVCDTLVCIFTHQPQSREQLLKFLLSCDVIVYYIGESESQVEEASWAMQGRPPVSSESCWMTDKATVSQINIHSELGIASALPTFAKLFRAAKLWPK